MSSKKRLQNISNPKTVHQAFFSATLSFISLIHNQNLEQSNTMGPVHRHRFSRAWPKNPLFAAPWIKRNAWTQEFPVFGLSKQGEYLDRLQRPTRVQTGQDMKTILKNDGHRIMLEIDTEGNYWQRPYCDEQNTFYNVQPCCVFPENPGRKSVSKEEAERLIEKYSR